MKIRGFEIAEGFENMDVTLPCRSTKNSAGYDFSAIEDMEIPSYYSLLLEKITKNEPIKPVLIKTGIKSYMGEDEVLILANRSSNPGKKGLILANSIGVIDSDYYGNPDNDGHIMFAFYNIKEEDIEIKKGDAIGQGIFQKYLVTDNDISQGERTGGFGSTSK